MENELKELKYMLNSERENLVAVTCNRDELRSLYEEKNLAFQVYSFSINQDSQLVSFLAILL